VFSERGLHATSICGAVGAAVAVAMLGGGLGVSHEDVNDAAARDPSRVALAALGHCVEDERCSASLPPSCA
jgi:hypothetical protein